MSAARRAPSRLLAVGLCAALFVTACGGSDDDSSSAPSSEPDAAGASATEPSTEPTPAAVSDSDLESEPAATEAPDEPDAEPAPTSTIDPRVDIDDLTLPEDAVAAPEQVELSEDDFPRTVTHEFGAAEISEPPTRIVASAGVADLDALISLGVVPYATSLYYPINFDGDLGLASWNSDYAGELITLPRDAAIEEFARLDPDLIVGQGPGQVSENFDLFSEIAPTVIHSYPTDWQAPITLFGEALGLEEEAVAAIDRVQAEVDRIAERVPDDAPSVAMVSPAFGEVTIYNENLGAGPARALASIGIEIVGPDGPISYERLGDLAAADWVIVFDFTLGPVDEFLEGPIFNQLPAVQSGNVVRLSPEQSFAWVIETSRSLPASLDGLLTAIGL
ncbi:MAG: ABC transporter substrate-binding protein [Actinomycetota bacterium]